jgi:hypothetical protein
VVEFPGSCTELHVLMGELPGWWLYVVGCIGCRRWLVLLEALPSQLQLAFLTGVLLLLLLLLLLGLSKLRRAIADATLVKLLLLLLPSSLPIVALLLVMLLLLLLAMGLVLRSAAAVLAATALPAATAVTAATGTSPATATAAVTAATAATAPGSSNSCITAAAGSCASGCSYARHDRSKLVSAAPTPGAAAILLRPLTDSPANMYSAGSIQLWVLQPATRSSCSSGQAARIFWTPSSPT